MSITKKITKEWGEFRNGVFVWKVDTPNYIKQLYKGLKKSKQQELPL